MKFIGAHIFDYDATFRGDVTIEGNLTISNSVSQTISFGDNDKLKFGDNGEFEIYHDGTNSYINNTNNGGHLFIQTDQTDKDIILKSDDGSGGVTAYLTLDGSNTRTNVHKNLRFDDNIGAVFGSGAALKLHSDGSNGIIDNFQGILYIRQQVDDQDIVFQCDDGSGSLETYFYLDGSANVDGNPRTKFPDNSRLMFGAGDDMDIFHDGTNSFIRNNSTSGDLIIQQSGADKDIIFKCDDGSGGTTEYFKLDGSRASASVLFTVWPDNSYIALGNAVDLKLHHNGTFSVIENEVGDLNIINDANDKDIALYCDDGSGGVTAYIRLDGSAGYTTVQKNIRFEDSVQLQIGTGGDGGFFHDGSNAVLFSSTGHLIIRNDADDRDVILQSDDGSGGRTAYITLDGGLGYTTAQKEIRLEDSVRLRMGVDGDSYIYHTGSAMELYNTTGDITIKQDQNDGDIIFQCDDGSGGIAEYFKLDGSLATHDGSSTLTMYTKWPDNSIISLGTSNDIRLYHNGTNSYLDNLVGDYYIRQKANDKDLILECDDGSGGNTAYIQLDGSDLSTKILTQKLIISNLPTSDPGVSGQVWNNNGVLNISAGG